MEIVKERSGSTLNLRLSGRLDHHWSQPLDNAIEDGIREGTRHVRLDLSDVTYLSSAGAAVLLRAYRDAVALQGSLKISAASDNVRSTLRQMELEDFFFSASGTEAPRQRTMSIPLPVESARATYESRDLDGGRSKLVIEGDPSQVTTGGSLAAQRNLYALGVGALGTSFDECRGFFGEFLAAAGSAAFMPTDGTSTPDYMASSGSLVPQIQHLYALGFRGSPAHQLRFEAAEAEMAVPMSEVVQACASLAGTSTFGIVMAAEIAGLVCTRLRRSPTQDNSTQFDFPAVREWLSFTPEREHARHSSLVVGVISASPGGRVAPFMRPVSDAFHGHVHAAVTTFRSLPRGRLEIADIVAQSFQRRGIFSVVHLLRDDRPNEGAGESEFHRGACWVFPIDEEVNA
jgi:anti-anti-sigma factor